MLFSAFVFVMLVFTVTGRHHFPAGKHLRRDMKSQHHFRPRNMVRDMNMKSLHHHPEYRRDFENNKRSVTINKGYVLIPGGDDHRKHYTCAEGATCESGCLNNNSPVFTRIIKGACHLCSCKGNAQGVVTHTECRRQFCACSNPVVLTGTCCGCSKPTEPPMFTFPKFPNVPKKRTCLPGMPKWMCEHYLKERDEIDEDEYEDYDEYADYDEYRK